MQIVALQDDCEARLTGAGAAVSQAISIALGSTDLAFELTPEAVAVGNMLEVVIENDVLLAVDPASVEAGTVSAPLPETRNDSGLFEVRLASAASSSAIKADDFEIITPAPPQPLALNGLTALSSGEVEMRLTGEAGA